MNLVTNLSKDINFQNDYSAERTKYEKSRKWIVKAFYLVNYI